MGALIRVGPIFMTPGVDPPAQLARVVADPLSFLWLLLTTVPLLPSLAEPFVGVLGHLDTRLPGPIYWLYPAALLGVAFFDGGARSPIRGAARAIFLAAAVLGGLSILSVAYVATNPGGRPASRASSAATPSPSRRSCWFRCSGAAGTAFRGKPAGGWWASRARR